MAETTKKDHDENKPAPGKTPEQAEGARDPGDKRAGEVDPGKTPDSDGERE